MELNQNSIYFIAMNINCRIGRCDEGPSFWASPSRRGKYKKFMMNFLAQAREVWWWGMSRTISRGSVSGRRDLVHRALGGAKLRMLNYEGGGWMTAWVQIRSCAFKICNNEARQMLKLKHDQLEHKIWQFYNRYSNVITSTNTYCRCDRIVWQTERFDSLNDLTAWMLWQLEFFDSLNALTAWMLWQLECFDSLTASTD